MAKVRVEFVRLQYKDADDGIKELVKAPIILDVGMTPTAGDDRPVSPGLHDTLTTLWANEPIFASWGPNRIATEENSIIVLPGQQTRVRANEGDVFSFMMAPPEFFAINEIGPARNVRTLWGVSKAGSFDVVPMDMMRKGLTIRNNSNAQMYLRTDGEAGDGIGYPLDARRGYSFEYRGLLPRGAVSLWCAEAGQKWSVLYSTDNGAYPQPEGTEV